MEKNYDRQKNAHIARRLATQIWGDVHSQKYVREGIWSFSTCSHGGYILDLDCYPEFYDKFKQFCQFVRVSKEAHSGRRSEQHFAAFEEDCDFAVLEYVLLDLMAPMFANNRNVLDSEYEEFYNEYRSSLLRSLEMWNKEWLLKYGGNV